MEEEFEESKSEIQKLTESIRELIRANKEAARAARDRAELDKELAKEADEIAKQKAAAAKLESDAAKKLLGNKVLLGTAATLGANALLSIASEGVKFASIIGTSATNGVRLELANRTALISQIKSLISLDVDRIVTGEQQRAAQQTLTNSFISTREGFELSAKGTQAFAANLKGGFKSEFQLTSESLRALITTGMSTTAQFENFRKASGRASLSSGQFANVVNKNSLSFLLYGPRFAKAAVDAEKLGISLSSLQSAQEGLVTNLDGTIDTVAQLNQLGANVDFGNLIRVAEQEGPDALMAYARATIPANLLQSASTRSLFKQLGISAEDFLKAGGKQKSTADSIEEQMTGAAKKTNEFGATLLTVGVRAKEILVGSFLNVGVAALFAAKAMYGLGFSGLKSIVMQVAGGLASLFKVVLPLVLLIGGIMMMFGGRKMVSEGKSGAGLLTGVAGGALAGAGAGAMLGSVVPVAGTAIGALIGAGIGLVVAGTATRAGDMFSAGIGSSTAVTATPANDMFSAGYGKRMLVTPTGAFAMNNADDIIAGTNLFPKGSLNAGSNNSDLVRKVDNLITVLSNANTTINVGGSTQTVPRMQLVGVYSRNEVR